MLTRRTVLVSLAFAGVAASSAASAEVYPSRQITVVVPFPAGGPTDTIARTAPLPAWRCTLPGSGFRCAPPPGSIPKRTKRLG
jgi:hypothetical protein